MIVEQLNPAEIASLEALKSIRECIDKKSCFRLEAGAGAGKTYSLIESLKYLLNEDTLTLSKSSQKIACITYTNVAKEEIKSRTDNHPAIFADTIHAFCWSLLHSYQVKLRDFIPTLSEKWAERIIGEPITNQVVKYDLGFPKITGKEISLHHDDVIFCMAEMLKYPKFQLFLKSKYPVIFIDEYQDTNLKLAKSLLDNVIDNNSGILVGLFGDHWQKIYGKNACGLIESSNGKIVEIGKRANFRSDKSIVDSLNRIRTDLPQEPFDPLSNGKIKVFHTNNWEGIRESGSHSKGDLPSSIVKECIKNVKEIAVNDGWDFLSTNTKILFLTNNLIAEEQNFRNLADCFEYSDDYLKKEDEYIEFFLDTFEPIIESFINKNYGNIFRLGGKNNFRLSCQNDKVKWSLDINKIMKLRESCKVIEILEEIKNLNTILLPEKIINLEAKYLSLIQKEDLDEKELKFIEKIKKIHQVEYCELINLEEFIEEKTPFSTKHGVKGAEFDNVLVVFGRGWNQYNWDQMLNWMSNTIPNGKQDSFERNRNLFYVSCSRAKHNLYLLFTQQLSESSIEKLEEIFGESNIYDNLIS